MTDAIISAGPLGESVEPVTSEAVDRAESTETTEADAVESPDDRDADSVRTDTIETAEAAGDVVGDALDDAVDTAERAEQGGEVDDSVMNRHLQAHLGGAPGSTDAQGAADSGGAGAPDEPGTYEELGGDIGGKLGQYALGTAGGLGGGVLGLGVGVFDGVPGDEVILPAGTAYLGSAIGGDLGHVLGEHELSTYGAMVDDFVGAKSTEGRTEALGEGVGRTLGWGASYIGAEIGQEVGGELGEEFGEILEWADSSEVQVDRDDIMLSAQQGRRLSP